LADDGSGDGYPLLLAAGQLGGSVSEAVRKSDAVQCLGGSEAAPSASVALVEQSGGDVVQRRECVEQMEALEDDPDVVRAQGSQLRVFEGMYGLPDEVDSAAVGAFEGGEDVQQRRLARAGRAGDGEAFAGL
jgi:hypothetical protein